MIERGTGGAGRTWPPGRLRGDPGDVRLFGHQVRHVRLLRGPANRDAPTQDRRDHHLPGTDQHRDHEPALSAGTTPTSGPSGSRACMTVAATHLNAPRSTSSARRAATARSPRSRRNQPHVHADPRRAAGRALVCRPNIRRPSQIDPHSSKRHQGGTDETTQYPHDRNQRHHTEGDRGRQRPVTASAARLSAMRIPVAQPDRRLVAAGYQVAVPDQRGYGGSDKPAEFRPTISSTVSRCGRCRRCIGTRDVHPGCT